MPSSFALVLTFLLATVQLAPSSARRAVTGSVARSLAQSSPSRDVAGKAVDSCADAVEGAIHRYENDGCKCYNYHEKVFCGMASVADRKFDPLLATCDRNLRPYCALEADPYKDPDAYVPIDKMVPTTECAEEFGIDGTNQGPGKPDIAKDALSWCDVRFVPEGQRVPEKLRGFYWMMNLSHMDEEMGFCTSLAEWHSETRTAVMAPWTHFILRRKAAGPYVPDLYKKMERTAGAMMQYFLTFSDDTLTKAQITTHSGLLNRIINFPLNELNATRDGRVTREKAGDIFDRPSSFLGHAPAALQYYAVRVVDQAGTVHPERYELMKHDESVTPGTLIHYKVKC